MERKEIKSKCNLSDFKMIHYITNAKNAEKDFLSQKMD